MRPDGRKKTCFVLMPFTVKSVDEPKYRDSHHWTEVYEGLIVPAVEAAGLVCERDDKDIASRLIGQDILRKILEADLIICDLSSHNPNVFLELGWALSSDKPYVLIKDDITDYVFDLNPLYTFTYSHTLQPSILRKQISGLTDAIGQTLDDRLRRYSLAARVFDSMAIDKDDEPDDLHAKILRHYTKLYSYPLFLPSLVKKGLATLFSLKTLIEVHGGLPDRDAINHDLPYMRHSRLYGVEYPFLQASIIDKDRTILFHDHEEFVGERATHKAIDETDFYDEVFRYPHGSVAWVDEIVLRRMVFTIISKTMRYNLALFTTMESSGWKLVIELHEYVTKLDEKYKQ